MDLTIPPTLENNSEFLQDWQHFLPVLTNVALVDNLEHYVNGKALACPMPLLKLKMALKNTAVGNHVYLTATDPNSERDIAAFCGHAGYAYITAKTDTIVHFLVTKNC